MSIAASEIIAAGNRLGVAPETILALIAEIDAKKVADRRAAATERQRRKRERGEPAEAAAPVEPVTQNDDVTHVTHVTQNRVTSPPPLSSPPSFSPTPPKPTPPIIPPTLSSSAGADVRALERECRLIVGSEPVALAQDFDALAAVLSEGVTPDDVIAGVRAGMGAPSFRPRSWRQFENWARRAAKDRLGQAPKVVPLTGARAPPERFGVHDAMLEMMGNR